MPEPRILSIIPPMTQLNTPYPSTAYLTGFLRSRGFQAAQADLSIGLALELLSVEGLRCHSGAGEARCRASATARRRASFSSTSRRIGPRFRRSFGFCRGAIPTLAHRIASRRLPAGGRDGSRRSTTTWTRMVSGDALEWAFGALGLQDRAKHIGTLYLNDLADVMRDAVDPRFEFVRYAESLAASQPTFDPLHEALAAPRSLVDATLHELTLGRVGAAPARLWCSSARRSRATCTARSASRRPSSRLGRSVVTVLGGGFCNTELRELNEPRVFDYFDFVTLDAGERPLLAPDGAPAGQRPLERLGAHVHARRCHYVDHKEPDIALLGERHADLGWPAAGRLSVAARHAQPDAPAVVRRPLEQAHRGARLLLEEVQLLRREPRLHLALRPGSIATCWSIASRPSIQRDGADGFPLRRRGRAAQGAQVAGAAGCWTRQARHLVVGQHPLREILRCRSCASCWRTAAASP